MDAATQEEAQRQAVISAGVAAVKGVEGTTFDAQIIAIAASFGLQLGKQFNRATFLAEVGRIRLRWLPPVVQLLTNGAGLYTPAFFNLVAPSDRHQLVLGVAFEVRQVTLNQNVQVRDLQQLTRLGVLDITRPQGDTVQEAIGPYTIGGEQHQPNSQVLTPGELGAEDRRDLKQWIMPMGIGQAITYAFGALLSPQNQITIALQNLAAAGVVTPSTLQLEAAMHTLVIDCIRGGN